MLSFSLAFFIMSSMPARSAPTSSSSSSACRSSPSTAASRAVASMGACRLGVNAARLRGSSRLSTPSAASFVRRRSASSLRLACVRLLRKDPILSLRFTVRSALGGRVQAPAPYAPRHDSSSVASASSMRSAAAICCVHASLMSRSPGRLPRSAATPPARWMDATSSSRGDGSPAPPSPATPAPGGIAPAIAAMSSSGSSISRRAMRASSLAAASTSFSSRMSRSTSSVYLLRALAPLSGTIVANSVSDDALSASAGGGTAFTTAAAPSGGSDSYGGTRTMYTHSLSRTARRSSAPTVCCSPVRTPVRLMLPPAFTSLRPSASSFAASCNRAIANPMSSSSSSAILAARMSASTWNAAALAMACAAQVRSKWSLRGGANSAAFTSS
mmetsp:Transcript_27702/g.68167  ORF Transcript_27702/g.68167 Transcript_27702/m.68167 type:complete len:386 (-) Transcript_27702:811-1968(-)